MGLHDEAAEVEADRVRVGARAQGLADVRMRQRVGRVGDRRELIARDLRRTPARDVVRRGRHGLQRGQLLGAKVLERATLRATVPTQAVLIETPRPGADLRVVERQEDFARKAIVADARHGALDPAFILRRAHPRGIDVEVARLRVLEKRRRDPRREWVAPTTKIRIPSRVP
jgi:hypothetical protein